DTANTFLVGGYGAYMTDDYALAAVSSDKTTAVIYTPVKHTLVLQLKQVKGKNVSMQWYDPTNGTYLKIRKKEFKKDGDKITLMTPDANSTGQSDWVLVVKSGE
ncbi:MAG: putative collagen-binding domain-containing protein, partial [Bacteroidota bacterium]|nr:putative collagen-binding domain-containing protein [Bacteroidota bacterium]